MHFLLFLLLLLPAGGLASAVSSAVCANNDCWCGSDATRAAYECKQGDAKYKCTNPGSTSYCAALTAKGCLLERMVVVPALQGKGVGSKCLKEALDAVAGRGQGVLLATQEARNVRFYEGLGFETIHETDFHEDFHENANEHTLAGGETVTGSTGFTGLTGLTAGEPIHNWFMFKSPPGRKGYGRALVEARRVKQLKRRDAEAAAAAVGGGRAGGGRAGAVGAGWRRVSRGRVAALVAVSAGLMFAVLRRGR